MVYIGDWSGQCAVRWDHWTGLFTTQPIADWTVTSFYIDSFCSSALSTLCINTFQRIHVIRWSKSRPELIKAFATPSFSFLPRHSNSSCILRKSGLAIECFTMLAIRSFAAPARRQCLNQSSRAWAAPALVGNLLTQCGDLNNHGLHANLFNKVHCRYVSKDFKPKDEVAKFHGQKDSNVRIPRYDRVLSSSRALQNLKIS
jgi:hypothetical protein